MECKIIGEYVKARNNIKGITKHDDSNYETEKELKGKGKRRKTNKILSSNIEDTEKEKLVKKSTKVVVPPPNVLRCDFYNAVSSCSYLNESQKKKFNIKVNSHKSWKQ